MLINHHVKYKEIHGIDETEKVTRREHMILHGRPVVGMKSNNPIPRKIAVAAGNRIHMPAHNKIIHDKRNTIDFNDRIDKNIVLRETMIVNPSTNTITWSSRFIGDHGRKIIGVDI